MCPLKEAVLPTPTPKNKISIANYQLPSKITITNLSPLKKIHKQKQYYKFTPLKKQYYQPLPTPKIKSVLPTHTPHP